MVGCWVGWDVGEGVGVGVATWVDTVIFFAILLLRTIFGSEYELNQTPVLGSAVKV